MQLSAQEYAQVMQGRNGGNNNQSWKENNNNQNWNQNNNQRPQGKKKSGAGHKMAAVKSGPNAGEIKPITWGWRASKMLGITKYTCTLTKYTKRVTSKSGREWLTGIAVSIVNAKLGTKGFAFGLMDARTGKVIVKEMSLVINPQGGVGGVVATIGAKKK